MIPCHRIGQQIFRVYLLEQRRNHDHYQKAASFRRGSSPDFFQTQQSVIIHQTSKKILRISVE